nr:hypothetical protein [Tanacetum cinerariifolium]
MRTITVNGIKVISDVKDAASALYGLTVAETKGGERAKTEVVDSSR